MMRAAIYARKSTDHQEDSTLVQVSRARDYIRAHGWTLEERHIFVDDSISRAEYRKRPQLYALLNAAERGELDVIAMRDVDRLGGDTNRNGVILSDLFDRGIRVDEYLTKNTVELHNATTKIMAMLKNFAAEMEREKTSQRTHEALQAKAARGLNVGGRCYGYNNDRESDGVHYRVNTEQAAVVREVFQMFVAGAGLRKLARTLNERGVPPPRAGRRGTGSWCSGSLRPMLLRERYRGVLKWGEFEKRYKLATKVRVRRSPDDEDRVRVDAPELRIVDDALWFAAQAKFTEEARRSSSRKGGRPPRYLLSGIARCAECGGPMTVINGRDGKVSTKMYACSYHRERGEVVCKNKARRPVETVDRTVIDWLVREVLDEPFIMAAIKELQRRFSERARTAKTELPSLEREEAKLRGEIQRLVTTIADGTEQPDILKAIMDRRERLSALEAQVRGAKETPRLLVNELGRVEAEARKRLERFQAFLAQKGEKGRQVVQAAFVGPIKVTTVDLPEGRRFRLEAEARIGKLLATEVSNVASPGGQRRDFRCKMSLQSVWCSATSRT